MIEVEVFGAELARGGPADAKLLEWVSVHCPKLIPEIKDVDLRGAEKLRVTAKPST